MKLVAPTKLATRLSVTCTLLTGTSPLFATRIL